MSLKQRIGLFIHNTGLLSPPFHLPYYRWLRLAILVTLDLVLVVACYWLSYLLRLDEISLGIYRPVFVSTLPILLAVAVPVFFFSGMYRQVWRYANFYSAMMVAKSTLLTVLIFSILAFSSRWTQVPPRSVPIIFWLLCTLTLIATRFSWRMWASFESSIAASDKERCLIYGAGAAGELFARHIVANPRFPYRAMGFIDDDANKVGRVLNGIRIEGTGQKLAEIAAKHDVKTIIIALHTTPGRVMREIVETCHAHDLKPLIMPDMATSLGEEVFKPRAVDIKDLLRRNPRSQTPLGLTTFFANKVVLVTGAGGSIGSEICRQIIAAKPRKLILLDVGEFNLYQIDLELRELGMKGIEICPVLGSVTNARFVDDVFKKYQPQLVLHAAAYKHVPLIETNPVEGICNNLLGTKVLAQAAMRYNVERFLLVSSDKAVRPTNVMGATKRACELYIQALQDLYEGASGFAAVRFGNVLGSSGSVVPRFMAQIQAGGPVTVTHPDVTRYFMLTSEAVSLVLQALALSKGGETFVLNMGEPIKIYDMAKQLILLAGKEPGIDIEIQFTGLRPGEKLYEELILDGTERHTVQGDLFVAVSEHVEAERVLAEVDALLDLTSKGDAAKCIAELWRLISWQPVPQGDNDQPSSTPATSQFTVH